MKLVRDMEEVCLFFTFAVPLSKQDTKQETEQLHHRASGVGSISA